MRWLRASPARLSFVWSSSGRKRLGPAEVAGA
jgi:hypothetical protein